jgi:hypothetical protein
MGQLGIEGQKVGRCGRTLEKVASGGLGCDGNMGGVGTGREMERGEKKKKKKNEKMEWDWD